MPIKRAEVDLDRPYIVYSDWASLKPIQRKPRHYIFHDTINSSSLNATRKITRAPVDARLVKDFSISEYDTVETIAPGGPLGLQQKTYSVEKAIPATRFNVDLTTIAGHDRGIWYEPTYKQLVVRVPEDFERDVIHPNLDEGWLTKVKVTIAAVVDACQPTSHILKSGFMAIPDIRLYRLSGRVKRIEVHREKTGSWAGVVTSVMKGVRFEGTTIAEWDG